MNKTIFAWCFVIVFIHINCNCKKKKEGCTDINSISYNEDAEKDDGSCVYGGSGGNTTIVAFPQHHTYTPIISHVNYPDSAFVKYNTIEFPGNDPLKYDTFYVGETGEDHVHLVGLKKGKYFIYMTGFDTTGNWRVKGGIPYSLYQESGEVDLAVPVSE